ncbi:type II pantothenate kinase [Kurthia senegalensis]|uniref:type II pantothenate kinase n=1 Tax=Kurthia senegalensis TaxID=1033740 RepID=UPI0002880767|nr:type II pantothenate kinase [Kurthia senegalensis]
MVKTIGIDAGGTLTKVAYMKEDGTISLQHFPSTKLEEVAAFINSHSTIETLGMTGGRTEQLNNLLDERFKLCFIVEFEATLKGVTTQLHTQDRPISKGIITNIGSGTSIHYKDESMFKRVGGTGVGGGTLMGLSGIMTNEYSFEAIANLAQNGKRHQIDLLVADIFEGMEVPKPLNPELTASNFGKVGLKEPEQFRKEDLIATTMGLVGEVVSTLSVQYAEQYDVENIVYIGTTLLNNPILKEIIQSYTEMKKKKAVFLEDNGFSGAIGALSYAEEQSK